MGEGGTGVQRGGEEDMRWKKPWQSAYLLSEIRSRMRLKTVV